MVKLQKWLKNQGYYTGDIDGSFGPYTEEDVKFFQNDSDIVVDGSYSDSMCNGRPKWHKHIYRIILKVTAFYRFQ